MEDKKGGQQGGVSSLSGLVFTKYTEVKDSGNHKRHHQFHLQDTEGNKHHAATAEDHGDAHYTYLPDKDFASKYGQLPGHSRKDLIIWLEMIINTSQRDAGIVKEIKSIGERTPQNPFGTYFVNFRQERKELPDKTHRHRWILTDQHGKEHVAVVGKEMPSRDGHYQYHAEEPFATQYPLSASNQQQVLHYVESLITHVLPPGEKADVAAKMSQAVGHAKAVGGADVDGSQTNEGDEARRCSTDAGTTGRGASVTDASGADASGEAGQPSTSAPAPKKVSAPTPLAATPRSNVSKKKGTHGAKHGKHKLSGAAAAAAAEAKRARRAVTPGSAHQVPPGAPPTSKLSAAQVARVCSAAAAESAHWAHVRAGIKAWAGGSAGEEETEVVKQWLVTLQQLQDDADKTRLHDTYVRPTSIPSTVAVMRTSAAPSGNEPLPKPEPCQTWSYEDDHQRVHGARLALECLRELSALCLPPVSMLDTGLVDTVVAYCGHPHPAVAGAARILVARWQRKVLGAAVVMTDPVYSEDAVAFANADLALITELEAKLQEEAALAAAAAAAAAELGAAGTADGLPDQAAAAGAKGASAGSGDDAAAADGHGKAAEGVTAAVGCKEGTAAGDGDPMLTDD